ncbi:MAG: hypothetical protein MJ234_00265 [bacterium]|nr:hypothetical protein [bacterium]
MESVFFDMNPSMRQFTDNSLRSNSMLHRAQNAAEGKTKTSKSAKAAKSGISMEASVSGEDMMGSMDLGEFRGGGSGFQAFSSITEDDEEREKQSANLAEMLASMKSASSEAAPSFVSDHHSPFTVEQSFTQNTEQPAGEKQVADADEQSSSILEPVTSCYTEQPVPDITHPQDYEVSPAEFSENSEPEEDCAPPPPAAVLVERAPSSDRPSKSDSVKISEENVQAEIAPKEKTEKKSSEWNSLLSFDEGFLIADDEKFKSSAAAEEEASAPSLEKVTIPKDAEGSDAGINAVIAAMLKDSSYLSDYEISVLNYYVGSFGIEILKLCLDSGVKIRVMPSDGSSFYSGGYSKKEKTCFIPQASLSSKQEFVSARFYMAMAFDHSLGDGDFSSAKSPAVLSSWHLCRSLERGHLFQDAFSASDPSLYFAQSAESFLREDGDVLAESPFFDCGELYDYDRTMFSYMEYLFGKFGKKRSKI